jgi:hypothetical protein
MADWGNAMGGFASRWWIGPALSGRALDRFHSYSQILSGYEIVLAVTCVLLLGLGKYTFAPLEHAPRPTINEATRL